MNLLRLLLLLALFCAGCSDPRTRAMKLLRNGGAERLRYDAALICKATFGGHGAAFVVIRPRNWPASFHAFAPRRVGAYQDGVTLALGTSHDLDRGLYIVPQSMDHEPRVAPGTRYEKIADGIYWYSFGD